MPIRLRVRGPGGTETLTAEDDWNLSQLVALIRDKTGVQEFSLKSGFPPAPLSLEDAETVALGELKLNGATLVLAPVEKAAAADTAAGVTAAATPSADSDATTAAPAAAQGTKEPFQPKGVDVDETVVEWEEGGGYLVLRVMPDDNSCMFTAFGGVLGIPDPASRLRREVAEHILTHPEKYSKVVLENLEPAVYAARIQDPHRWGGAIELQCLSEIYNIQICSIDVKYGRVDTYGLMPEQQHQPASVSAGGTAGDDNNSNKGRITSRCVLVYSGIHYDRVAQSFDLGLPVDLDVTRWSAEAGGDGDAVLEKALELAAKLKRARYYTDMETMAITCAMPGCENWLGAGERDMIRHTKETGHTAFSELPID